MIVLLNALDALATTITIFLDFEKFNISVSDNGIDDIAHLCSLNTHRCSCLQAMESAMLI